MKELKYILLILVFTASCSKDVDYVDPTWARAIFPHEGSTVRIDFFKPDDYQVFTWEVRKDATYKIYFDVDMHFENAYVFDMGTADTLRIKNSDFIEILREVFPDFSSVKRFFWKVEQNTGEDIQTTWRYFSAIIAVESFIDARDGEEYGAEQFVINDGTLITIMSENLRAKVYADGTPLTVPYKGIVTNDPIYDQKIGNYYSWATVVNTTWDDAKTATLNNESIQGICPDGWHVPSFEEFSKLREYFSPYNGANNLKDPSYWFNTDNVTNSSKLNVMASGYYWHEGVPFVTQGLNKDEIPFAGFWSSTPFLKGMEFSWGVTATDDDKGKATLMSLYDDSEEIALQGYGIVPGQENRMYPVRCIMNNVK